MTLNSECLRRTLSKQIIPESPCLIIPAKYSSQLESRIRLGIPIGEPSSHSYCFQVRLFLYKYPRCNMYIV